MRKKLRRAAFAERARRDVLAWAERHGFGVEKDHDPVAEAEEIRQRQLAAEAARDAAEAAETAEKVGV